MTLPKRILIDTDIGDDIDDAIAIAYALNNPAFQIEGITTVGHGGEQRARIVKALVDAAKMDIPVVIGRETSSTGYPVTRQSGQRQWAGKNLRQGRRKTPVDVVRFIYETALRFPNELYIVTLGPLTNIAEALTVHPDLSQLLAGIYIMGGEIEVFRREHNFAADYMAADTVLRLTREPNIATWSVGQQLVLKKEQCELFQQVDHPHGQLLSQLISAWEGEEPVLYDIVPLIWLERPDLIDRKTMQARIETVGLYTRGVLVDMETHATGLELRACTESYMEVVHGAWTHVTAGIDTKAAMDMVASRLLLSKGA